MRDADGLGGGAVFVYQGTALNADERDWLTEARREQQEAPIEEQPFGLAFLVSTLVASREADELEYIAHRLWAAAPLKTRGIFCSALRAHHTRHHQDQWYSTERRHHENRNSAPHTRLLSSTQPTTGCS
jgi:hypothetical protein